MEKLISKTSITRNETYQLHVILHLNEFCYKHRHRFCIYNYIEIQNLMDMINNLTGIGLQSNINFERYGLQTKHKL